MDYVKPCQKFTEPIANFPMPANTDDIHSLFDLINQVSYAFALSEKLRQLQRLLQPDTPFIWSNQMNDLFLVIPGIKISHHP